MNDMYRTFRGDDMVECERDMATYVTIAGHDAALQQAVAAQREKDAKVVEQYGDEQCPPDDTRAICGAIALAHADNMAMRDDGLRQAENVVLAAATTWASKGSVRTANKLRAVAKQIEALRTHPASALREGQGKP